LYKSATAACRHRPRGRARRALGVTRTGWTMHWTTTERRTTAARWAAVALALLSLAPRVGVSQFDRTAWRIEAEQSRVVRYAGRQALLLRDGVAWLPDATFENGTIELDVAVRDTMSFIGVRFRMQDADDYEDFYIRPFMSGNPDATQYQPVFRGNTGWQIYVGDRYTAPLRFRFGAWMHVKLVIDGTRADVWVDGQRQHIPALLRPVRAGMIGLSASTSSAHFANVRIRPTIDAPIAARAIAPLPTPSGAVTAWRVSSAFPERRLVARDRLTPADTGGLTWTRVEATERGIANLGTLARRGGDTNTVIAALTLTADVARLQRLRFGFSDRVRIYLNGRLLYAGDDGFRTRDYRFLGTVGLYDEVVLPLEAGTNALWLAVSESFGGWAVTAAIDPTPGLTIAAGTP
jgi:hypothetical protein